MPKSLCKREANRTSQRSFDDERHCKGTSVYPDLFKYWLVVEALKQFVVANCHQESNEEQETAIAGERQYIRWLPGTRQVFESDQGSVSPLVGGSIDISAQPRHGFKTRVCRGLTTALA